MILRQDVNQNIQVRYKCIIKIQSSSRSTFPSGLKSKKRSPRYVSYSSHLGKIPNSQLSSSFSKQGVQLGPDLTRIGQTQPVQSPNSGWVFSDLGCDAGLNLVYMGQVGFKMDLLELGQFRFGHSRIWVWIFFCPKLNLTRPSCALISMGFQCHFTFIEKEFCDALCIPLLLSLLFISSLFSKLKWVYMNEYDDMIEIRRALRIRSSELLQLG